MTAPPAEVQRRLLFLLHRALVEARLLAQAGETRQLFDLADTFEWVPARMSRWGAGDLDQLRHELGRYCSAYPTAFRYVDYVDRFELPDV